MDDEQSTDPSLRPPLYGNQAEVSQTCSWVLLDLYAYIADRENSTSVSCCMSDGTRIRGTFCAAPPPLVSYLCVWCPDLQPTELAMRNTILAAESDLLLFCISLRCWERGRGDYFVYKAAGRNHDPSLTRLPDPSSFLTRRYNISLLAHDDVCGGRTQLRLRACGEEAYFYMAVLKPNVYAGGGHYDLSVFRSRNGKWTTSDVFVDSPYCYHSTSKVVALGESGMLAFVDLWRGMVICDVLCRKSPRYVPLPPPLIRPDNVCEDPLRTRDIVFIGGRLTVVELCHINHPGSCAWSWEVSAWSRLVTDLWEEDWYNQHIIQSSEIDVDVNTDNVSLLPMHKDSEGRMTPAIASLCTDHPSLSLSDCNVVYIMAKVSHRDEKALVLSVDMSTKRLQGLAEFSTERMFQRKTRNDEGISVYSTLIKCVAELMLLEQARKMQIVITLWT